MRDYYPLQAPFIVWNLFGQFLRAHGVTKCTFRTLVRAQELTKCTFRHSVRAQELSKCTFGNPVRAQELTKWSCPWQCGPWLRRKFLCLSPLAKGCYFGDIYVAPGISKGKVPWPVTFSCEVACFANITFRRHIMHCLICHLCHRVSVLFSYCIFSLL